MTTQKVIFAKFIQELRDASEFENLLLRIDPNLSSLSNIFKLIWTHKLTNKLLNYPEGNTNINKKGQIESEQFRNIGNRLYKQKKLDKALTAYNYAILSAPHPIEKFTKNNDNINKKNNENISKYNGYECLSYAYANRSVLLVEMEQYIEAILDINKSMKYGYPLEKQYKLIERKSKCLILIGNYSEAEELLEKLSNLISNIKLDKNEIKIIKNNIIKLKLKCSNENKEINTINNEENKEEKMKKYLDLFFIGPQICPKVSNPRKNYPTISEYVKVGYSKSKGRYLIATNDIEPGEILLREDSYCNSLNLGHDLRHYCNFCMKSTPTPLPCTTCSLVVFCSAECQSASLAVGGPHSSECSILPNLVAMDTDIDCMLVLGSLLPCSNDKLHYLINKYNSSNEESYIIDDMDTLNQATDDLSERIFTSTEDNFKFMYNLEGNIYNRPIIDILEASVSAVLLVKLILFKTYSINKTQNDQNKKIDTNLLGGLVLRLLLNFQCNAHCIKELQLKSNELTILSKLAIIGYGVYCNLSLVNHSCNPNVLHSTSGKTKFMYSISLIKKGDEICDSYGERFVSHLLKDRQKSIEKTYHFKCDCIACNEDWPLFNDLPNKFSLKCFKCSNSIDKETSKCNSCNIYYIDQNVSTSTSKTKKKSSKKQSKTQNKPLYDASEIRKKISVVWENYNIVTNNLNKNNLNSGQNDLNVLKNMTKLLAQYSVHPNKPLTQVQEFLMRYFDLNSAVTKLTN